MEVWSDLTGFPSRFDENAMKNHCAYCHGKFGLVRHRRGFKTFCSRKCVDHSREQRYPQRDEWPRVLRGHSSFRVDVEPDHRQTRCVRMITRPSAVWTRSLTSGQSAPYA
jgi:hypothetical protein